MEGGLDGLSSWAAAVMLASLRVAPVFALAPPFSLVRVPGLIRGLMGLALAAVIVSARPELYQGLDLSTAGLFNAAIAEFALGMMFVLIFQLVFAALYLAGRTIDVQAGYGLALLIDPTTRTQTPLAGTLFALAAGAIFFAIDGHLELYRVIATSFDPVPLGGWALGGSIDRMLGFTGVVFAIGMGVAGAAMLSLFLVDIVIAALSRTVPQMNVLLLGFQVKALVFLIALPASFGLAGGLLLRMMRLAIEAAVEVP